MNRHELREYWFEIFCFLLVVGLFLTGVVLASDMDAFPEGRAPTVSVTEVAA